MKKVKVLGLAVLLMGLLSGCEKFTPQETAISVNKKGEIVSFVKESFDKDYYDADELEASIDQAILNYNDSHGTENVEKEKFEVKNKSAELTMKFTSGEDYAEFNDVTLYSGDVVGAYHAGYDFSGGFQSVEKGQVTGSATGADILSSYNYGILVLDEEIDVQVPGNIVYASDNVEVTGKKTAKVLSGDETNESVLRETDASGIISITPVSVGGEQADSEGNTAELAYILYE